MATELKDCRRCQQIRSGASMVPYCRTHQRDDWERWLGVNELTRCLHCTHDPGTSPDWCPHCGHEGHGRQNDPETCVHCALVSMEVRAPHREVAALEGGNLYG